MITQDVLTQSADKITTFGIEFVSWDDIKQKFERHNPKLYQIVEAIHPNPDWKLVRAVYPFGAKIISGGDLMLPLADGSVTPKNDPRIPRAFNKALSYHAIPLAYTADKNCEIYLLDETRIVPLHVLKHGDLFGVFELIDPDSSLRPISDLFIHSGARTVFMLPKITDSASHKRLAKELRLRSPIPRQFHEQGPLFAEIANSSAIPNKWTNELIFFTKDWITATNQLTEWMHFKSYLYQYAWQQSQFWRAQSTIGMLWKNFAKAMNRHHLKPHSYLAETVRHLLFIASGSVPSFRPQGHSQDACPSKLIQQVYLDVYGLKSQFPTLMATTLFHAHEKNPAPGYYSLSLPTLLDYSGQPKQQMTIIEEERAIKMLMTALESELASTESTMSHIFNTTCFDYFHTDHDNQEQIQHSQLLAQADPTFMQSNLDIHDKAFAATSLFFRGCLRISSKSKQKSLFDM